MTIWTIRVSLLLFVIAIIGRLSRNSNATVDSTSRWIWSIATVLYVAHVVCAFDEYHRWSHSAAVDHTAAQSERTIGFRFGAGIYFNHLFTALCLAESFWWWLNPLGYQNRRRWVNVLIYGYLGFMAFNAAVVFAQGPMRAISLLVALSLPAWGWCIAARRARLAR